MNIIKRIVSSAICAVFMVPFLATGTTFAAEANIENSLCAGANLDVTDPNCDGGNAGQTVNDIIATVINIFSIIVGVIAVIMIIIGGIKYITSGGDSNNISSAKTTIIYAIIGLVVVALAQVIVRFVLERVSQATD